MKTQIVKDLLARDWIWDPWMPGKLLCEGGSINLNFKDKVLVIYDDDHQIFDIDWLIRMMAYKQVPRKIIQAKLVDQEFMPAYIGVEYDDKDAEILFYIPAKGPAFTGEEFIGMTEEEARAHYMAKV